jgi:hypothetical protein
MFSRQGADRERLPFLRPPEVVAGADGNPCEPMLKCDRVGKLRQPDVGSDEYIMGDFVDTIRGDSSTDDSSDVLLVSADEIGKAIDFSAADTAQKLFVIRGCLNR